MRRERLIDLRTVLFALTLAAMGAFAAFGADVVNVHRNYRLCVLGRCVTEASGGTAFRIGSIGDESVYVTALHVIDPRHAEPRRLATAQLGETHVRIGGECLPATIRAVGTFPHADVAIVTIRGDGDGGCYPVLETGPRQGDAVRFVGLVGGKTETRLSSRIESVVGSDVTIPLGGDYGGMSGGPMLVDRGGEGFVVGIMSRGSGRSTTFTSSTEIVRLCRQAFGRLPDCGKPAGPIAPIPDPIFDPPLPPAPPIPIATQPDRSAEILAIVQRMESRQSTTEERLTLIEREIVRIEAKPGPPGQPGAPGIPGAEGRQGPPGKDGASASRVELDAMAARIKVLEAVRIPVEILNDRGEVIDSESYPLGQPIRLRGTYRPKGESGAN